MKIKDIKISQQLRLGFGVIMILVIFLSWLSYIQTEILFNQTKSLYDHPLQTRRAIGDLKSNVLNLNRYMYKLLITENDYEKNIIKNEIALEKIISERNVEILYNCYLGSKSDLDSVFKALVTLNTMHDENLNLLEKGEKDEVINRMYNNGATNNQVDKLISKIDVISKFAFKKSVEFYNKSNETNNSLNIQLVILALLILLITIYTTYKINININSPLKELINITQLYQKGKYSVRSQYDRKNEFGTLSESFNTLAEIIEENLSLKEKEADINKTILKTDNIQELGETLLYQLIEYTHTQIGAIYLISENNNVFEHLASIGLNNNKIINFSSIAAEGEFGKVLLTKKIEAVKNIDDNSAFNYLTINGLIKAKEFVTMPILSGNDVIAVISLASVNPIDESAYKLLNSIKDILNARFIGLLAIRKIITFSSKLEIQNIELESQKKELFLKTNELSEQNIELETQKKQLDEANKLKTVFLSNMSHELRTPLNSVIALSGVLSRKLKGEIEDEVFNYIEVIERNGKHLLSLINDILDLSKIESGQETIELKSFDIKELINDIFNLLQSQAEKNHNQLSLKTDILKPVLISDYKKVKHILFNLTDNAIKFTHNGKIEISIKESDNNYKIVVSDSGIGIAEENLDHIFDEFRQADTSTSRKYGGTGLGLSIAKKYAILLNGNISVESKYGEGSNFTLIIPKTNISYIEKIEPDYYNDEVLTSKSNAITILVVEDNEIVLIQMKEILAEVGYNIKYARNGTEAINIIKIDPPDAVILDLMMPETDGFDVIKFLRNYEMTKKLPVIILTAKQILKDEYDFFKTNNIYQIIQKGDINKEDLLKAINGMIRKNLNIVEKNKIGKSFSLSTNGKPKVLIVEDNPDNLLTTKVLLGEDYIIYEAEDGYEGIKQAKEHLPNIILMDIEMPGMNGIETFHKLQQIEELRKIPVIAVTASVLNDDKEKIMSVGFKGFISKPINENILIETLKFIINEC